jgi:dTDP-4-dehydrorhamnose 3,5-epimerase
MHRDARGCFTEIHRRHWPHAPDPVQWNAVRSRRGVLRGVHVHLRHSDYFLLLAGRALIGLTDLRPASPTYRTALMVPLDSRRWQALEIPPGVAHGFLFTRPSLHAYAVSHYWDPSDELGCRWDDPGLGLDWPCWHPRLSARDAALGSLADLEDALAGRLMVLEGVR